jgi:hypothetical protein
VFRYTLLGDGASDRCLVAVVDWLLSQIPGVGGEGFISQVADLRGLSPPPLDLRSRIRSAHEQLPCDLLFVHRDAEGVSLGVRIEEIRVAAESTGLVHVPVVPVRMTEAWLLIEEDAIRRAADNPSGRTDLPLPALRSLERESHPKDILRRCLIVASEKRGRRLDQFQRDLPSRIHRVAELITDYAPLRQLPAFARFEVATREVVASLVG